MKIKEVIGDLLDQDVEVIVNTWNRNIIPWWLLLPQGVSGAIKHRAGLAPFRELAHKGVMPLGSAVLTAAGRLPYRAIIHVAGINMLWRSSERAIRDSVRNAISLAHAHHFSSIAFPIIGAGSGGFNEQKALDIMLETLQNLDYEGDVRIVRFNKRNCYCNLWEKSPVTLEQQGIPHGYCGICEKCGKPGHLRHFPGPVPYTGGWCDRHYRTTMILSPRGIIGILLWIGLVIAAIMIGNKILSW